MTDYVITDGRIPFYPPKHYGAHFTGSRATFCLDADFAGLDANVLAIPNLPITVLSSSPVAVGDEFFGIHVHKRANDSLVGMAGVASRTVRSHDMQSGKGLWKSIQPSRGVYDWTTLDSWVNTHRGAGRDLIFTLFGTPPWASIRPLEVGAYGPGNPGVQAEPADMADWSAFCTALATRYLGKIKYYEVWNEPNYNNDGTGVTAKGIAEKVFFYSGTFAKLSEMVRRANQAIKAVDPAAKILCPAVQGWRTTSGASDTYFTGMMAASDGATGTMKDWVDIIGVHLYLPEPNKVQDLGGIIDGVNAAKAAVGVSALPTWDTESAPIGPEVIGLSDKEAKAVIGRSMLTMAAKGIARTVYYQYDHGTMGVMSRPAIAAYREQIASLLRSGVILTVSSFRDGRVAYYSKAGLTFI